MILDYIKIPLFFPLLIWGAVALAGVFTALGITEAFKDPKKNKLGVLGMQISGKTRFLSFLRGIPYVEKRTGRDEYEEFTYTLSNGKKIFIKSGVDIGGGKFYQPDYDEIIKVSDVLLYFFDINKYLRNMIDSDSGISYQRSCNSRFEHIYDRAKVNKIPVLIIATHKDECNVSENQIKLQFDALVKDKMYRDMLKSIEYVNLTNSVETRDLINKIFK